MAHEEFKSLDGHFFWSFGEFWFIETEKGNFVWSDCQYNGDGSVSKYNGSLQDWCNENHFDFVRDKGIHNIGEFSDPSPGSRPFRRHLELVK